jgi:D-3-phosphoglycerate dehydrogenase
MTSPLPIEVFVSTSRFDRQNLRAADALSGGRLRYTFNPHGRKLTEEEVSHVLSEGFVGLIAGLEPLSESVLSAATALRVIARVGTGLDTVDLNAAERLGVSVCNTPDATTDAVAELTMAHMLSVLRGVARSDRSIRAGGWSPFMGKLLKEKTVGIVGFGRIGRRVAELVNAFGAHVIFSDPVGSHGGDSRKRTLMQLCSESDIITLHVPLLPETRMMIGAKEINAMKPQAILLNIARGGLVDEDALTIAVTEGRLSAGLDCFQNEPYQGPLNSFDDVTMTAHMGSYAEETRQLMEREAAMAMVQEFQRLSIL